MNDIVVTDEPESMAPRRNVSLVGHQAAESELLQLVQTGRLPHAILIGGVRGIGKATLAFRFARFLLSQAQTETVGLFGTEQPAETLFVSADSPISRRIAASGHADLLTVERTWDYKKKRFKGDIVVDDVRAISSFLHLTSAEGGWRIVIVDGADEMNRSAANALLKILEEPPKRALLILVCHSPGSLLSTVRSRCRHLMLQPLAESEVYMLLTLHRPLTDPIDREAITRLADGSIGRAIELADSGGLRLYRDLLLLLDKAPNIDSTSIYRLAEQLAREDDSAYQTMTDLILNFISRLVTGGAEGTPRDAVPEEAILLSRLATIGKLDHWIDLWDQLRQLFARAEAVNLDRKQVILDAFFQIRQAARDTTPT